jgi:hypothetical protein
VKIAHQFIGGKKIHDNPSSPEGTNEIGLFTIVFFNRPYGTLDLGVSQFPEINLWAIFILSLRDKTSASKLTALAERESG